MILRRRKEIAARSPTYNSGPVPKVHTSVPTSITPKNFPVMDDTHPMPHPNPHDPAYEYPTTSSPKEPYGNLQESAYDSHPPMYTRETQSVPYNHAYHPHKHPISSPTLSVNSDNGYGNLQGNASNSHLHLPMYAPNTQSVYHHNAYNPTSGYRFSGPSISVNSGRGNVTNTTISNVGNNNSSNTYRSKWYLLRLRIVCDIWVLQSFLLVAGGDWMIPDELCLFFSCRPVCIDCIDSRPLDDLIFNKRFQPTYHDSTERFLSLSLLVT